MSGPADQDVREMLERRAADVRPSPDAWDRIATRLDAERAARPAPVRLLAAAVVVAVVAAASVIVGARPPDPRVTTAPPAEVASPEPGDRADDVVAVWPATTVLGLKEVQVRVQEGAQPELRDPVGAARTYLGQRLGFVEQGPAAALSVGSFRADGATGGEVPYEAGGVRGTVVLRRVGGEGAIWSVVASTTEHLAVHRFGYDGQRVTGEVVPAADGRLMVHLAGPGATLVTAGPAEPARAGRPITVDGELPGQPRVVVLLRLAASGGGAGVVEFLLAAAPAR